MQLDFTTHAEKMLKERNISREWVDRTVAEPLLIENREDGTIHYLKSIPENEGRILRVVLNPNVRPNRVITIFFDRKARRQL